MTITKTANPERRAPNTPGTAPLLFVSEAALFGHHNNGQRTAAGTPWRRQTAFGHPPGHPPGPTQRWARLLFPHRAAHGGEGLVQRRIETAARVVEDPCGVLRLFFCAMS
jgi:hypothetical protein